MFLYFFECRTVGCPTMLNSFFKDRSGTFAVAAVLVAIPLMLSVGLAVDYSRQVAARNHIQELADGASLALAASRETDEAKLRQMAEDFVAANLSDRNLGTVEIANLNSSNDQIDLTLKSQINTTFMRLANVVQLDVGASALAVRAVRGSIEVALVLDNTWSMSDTDANGVSRIETLKQASEALVTRLLANEDADARIGLVPYADHVNVGIANRNASWLSVPKDKTIKPSKPKICETKTTKSVCVAIARKYSCTKTIDGIKQPATCGGNCTKTKKENVSPYQSCSGGGSDKKYTWYGCVGSRKQGWTRLHDGSPSTTYPGYIETAQKCLNPIVPLTADKDALLAAIDGMIINIGSYKPYTYIPAGLIWGQNLVSPPAPFSEGGAYDPDNVNPRKVVVLMTDGENTLRFNPGDGRHVFLNSNATVAKLQLAQTNSDTAAICEYMKSNNIEVFTVAFMVTNPDAKNLLMGCATDPEHYYDASDPDKLLSAFSGIADSLSVIRLAR